MYNDWFAVGKGIISGFCILLCFLCGSSLYAGAPPVARDPTEPFSDGEASATDDKEKREKPAKIYVLDAVLISGGNKFAIINNKLVKVGDTIGTNKVNKISAYQVTLVGETGEIELELFGNPIKETAK